MLPGRYLQMSTALHAARQLCCICLHWPFQLITALLLCSDPNLHFVEQVALAPPEVQIDQQQQAEYEKQLHDAAAMPLPDADDDDIAE